jgi:hypothetical protein
MPISARAKAEIHSIAGAAPQLQMREIITKTPTHGQPF